MDSILLGTYVIAALAFYTLCVKTAGVEPTEPVSLTLVQGGLEEEAQRRVA